MMSYGHCMLKKVHLQKHVSCPKVQAFFAFSGMSQCVKLSCPFCEISKSLDFRLSHLRGKETIVQ